MVNVSVDAESLVFPVSGTSVVLTVNVPGRGGGGVEDDAPLHLREITVDCG